MRSCHQVLNKLFELRNLGAQTTTTRTIAHRHGVSCRANLGTVVNRKLKLQELGVRSFPNLGAEQLSDTTLSFCRGDAGCKSGSPLFAFVAISYSKL